MTPRPRQSFARWLALAVSLSWWATPAPVLAQPKLRVVLEYSADPALGCPSGSELSANVSRQLGYDPFAAEGSEQRLRLTIGKVAERAEARLEWIDRQQQSEGERRLTSDGNCNDLVANLAFAVAVQIQLHAASTPPPPPPPAVAPPPTVSPPAPPRAAHPPPIQRVIYVGVGALARHGLTPGTSPGLRIFGALAQERWALELSAHTTLPSELQQTDGTGFTARELGANLAPCLRLPPVGLCAAGSLSLLHAQGQGVDQARSPSVLTAGVGGRLQLVWPALERFGIIVQGEVLAVLLPREVLLNRSKVWSTEPVAVTAILDFAAIFK